MSPILGSRAIRLRHLLARSSSPAPAPSSMVLPNAATLATAMRPSRRNFSNYRYYDRKCRERYDWVTWRVLPILVLLSWYGKHKQNKRIKKLNESIKKLNESVAVLNEKGKEKENVAVLNEKVKENEKTCCCCGAPTAKNQRIEKLMESVAMLNEKEEEKEKENVDMLNEKEKDKDKEKKNVAMLNEKEKEKKCCCCCAPTARGATTASSTTADATTATTSHK